MTPYYGYATCPPVLMPPQQGASQQPAMTTAHLMPFGGILQTYRKARNIGGN